MMISMRYLLVECIAIAVFILPIWAALGETLDLGLLDRAVAAVSIALPLEDIVFGAAVGWC
jgi:hypothetical protein